MPFHKVLTFYRVQQRRIPWVIGSTEIAFKLYKGDNNFLGWLIFQVDMGGT